MKRKIDHVAHALALGMAVPALYFGIQIAAAPFYPGYSFLSRDASTLGSDGSSAPWLFNVGSLILGIVTVLAAWGFLRALQGVRANPIMAWLTSLAVLSSGLAGINAFIFPLPDPRHTQGILALCGSGTLLLPALLPAVLWKLAGASRVKTYLILNIIVFLALIPIMSGLIQRISMMTGVAIPGYQSFLNGYQGLLQRIGAVVVFGPIGVGAYLLRNAPESVSGTTVWRDGSYEHSAAIKTGSFEAKTSVLKLEGEAKRPDGMVVEYAIEGKIQGDTVTGTFKFGDHGGEFTFKRQ
jgi:hypothetical membrane protein